MKKYTIEVDCPDGFEPVAFRRPLDKEEWVGPEGNIRSGANALPRLIVHKIWAAPEWMKPGWLTEDKASNEWYWTLIKPEGIGYGSIIDRHMLKFEPPEWHGEPIPVNQPKDEQ